MSGDKKERSLHFMHEREKTGRLGVRAYCCEIKKAVKSN